MVNENPKKSPYSETHRNSRERIVDWWNKRDLKSKFLILIISCLVIISIAGLSGVLAPDKNAQKIDTLNQIENALEGAQPIIIDPYTTINAYRFGYMDANTATSKLQGDKSIVDGLILQMQSINPSDGVQHSYGTALSALQDLSKSLELGINGIQNNNSKKMNQAINLDIEASIKFDQANNEVYNLRYSLN